MGNVPDEKRSERALRPWFGGGTLGSLWKEMDDLFQGMPVLRGSGGETGNRLMSLDLSETPQAVEAKLDLPGFKSEDIHVEVRDERLLVKGERTEETEEKDKTWHRVERQSGSFSRIVPLPCAVDEQSIEANYEDGVLHIHMPKRVESQGRKIDVKRK